MELTIGPGLVGTTVRSASRPEWGEGKVLRVQSVAGGNQPPFRVSIQFKSGHRTMVVPPAKLILPTEELDRESGWLDKLGHGTADDRLRALPESAVDVLAGPQGRLAAVLPLFAYEGSPDGLVTWARRQTDVADPLTHWNRDELEAAFAIFCRERDALFRARAAELKMKEGPEALRAALDELPAALKAAVAAALSGI